MREVGSEVRVTASSCNKLGWLSLLHGRREGGRREGGGGREGEEKEEENGSCHSLSQSETSLQLVPTRPPTDRYLTTTNLHISRKLHKCHSLTSEGPALCQRPPWLPLLHLASEFSPSPPSHPFVQQKCPRTFRLPRHERIAVRMREHPSPGCSWRRSYEQRSAPPSSPAPYQPPPHSRHNTLPRER